MKKYTANYAWTNPNFIIQNLVESPNRPEFFPLLCVLKNILQRGFPTTMSQYLQSEIGAIQEFDNFKERFILVGCEMPKWFNTIKGDKERNFYPAKTFFEQIISQHLGNYSFIQSLIVPEIGINELVGEHNKDFINQQVDFYLPQAKLVIEIDGQQHKLDDLTHIDDNIRDNYLNNKGITTVRISTLELAGNGLQSKIDQIIAHLSRYEKLFANYRKAYHKHKTKTIKLEEYQTKLLPTAIIRFQILLIELLSNGYLNFVEKWKFNIVCEDGFDRFAELAIEDIFSWMKQLWRLRYQSELQTPDYDIELVKRNEFQPMTSAINIDFSLFNKYTDEDALNRDIIYIRSDYFDFVKEKNHFRVSTGKTIMPNPFPPI